jgi:hypothetical protein
MARKGTSQSTSFPTKHAFEGDSEIKISLQCTWHSFSESPDTAATIARHRCHCQRALHCHQGRDLREWSTDSQSWCATVSRWPPRRRPVASQARPTLWHLWHRDVLRAATHWHLRRQADLRVAAPSYLRHENGGDGDGVDSSCAWLYKVLMLKLVCLWDCSHFFLQFWNYELSALVQLYAALWKLWTAYELCYTRLHCLWIHEFIPFVNCTVYTCIT